MATQIRTRPAGISGATVAWAVTVIDHGYEGALKLLRLIEDPFTQVQVNASPDGEDWQPSPSIEQARGNVAALAPTVAADLTTVPAEIVAAIRQIAEVQIQAIAAGRLALPTLLDLSDVMEHLANLPIIPPALADEDPGAGSDKTLAELFADGGMDLTGQSAGAGLPTAGPTLEREESGNTDTPPAKRASAKRATQSQSEPEEDRGPAAPAGELSTPAQDSPVAKAQGEAKAEPEA